MTRRQAEGWLKRAEKNGYVACHSGICHMEDSGSYGVNIDGDGSPGRPFGCPRIFCDEGRMVEFFRGRHGIEFAPYADRRAQ